MKTILVPFREDDSAQVALETACVVADRFGSHIEGLFVPPTRLIVAGDGVVVVPTASAYVDDEARVQADRARGLFDAAIRQRGLMLHDVTFRSDKPTAGWRELEGQESQVVAEYSRLFDLIVMGRTQRGFAADWTATCEAALFEGGRPVLIAGREPLRQVGGVVAIAWNGSTETARTIGLAMPLIATATSVVVLSVEEGMVPGPSGEQVAKHLLRHGVEARAVAAKSKGRAVGETILDETAAAGADLLVKGAYTQSRLRQMIFGGATQHILNNATVPVVMAH